MKISPCTSMLLCSLCLIILMHEADSFILPIPIPIVIIKKFFHALKVPAYDHVPVYKEVVVKKPPVHVVEYDKPTVVGYDKPTVVEYDKPTVVKHHYPEDHYDGYHEAHVEVKKPAVHLEITKHSTAVVKEPEYTETHFPDVHYDDHHHHHKEDYGKSVIITKRYEPPKTHYIGGASLHLSVTSH